MLFAWFVVWGNWWFVLISVGISLVWAMLSAARRQYNEEKEREKAEWNSPRVIREKIKICPQCIEEIKPKAKVCRFCGYVFPVDDPSRDMPPSPRGRVSPDDAFDSMLDEEIRATPKRPREQK